MEKYSKIQQVYNKKFLRDIDPKTPVQITEKLHGTNLSFVVNHNSLVACSRNQELTDGFYNHTEIQDKYADRLDNVFRALDCKEIQIYGEYVGPGIQKGINYGERDWYVFDIKRDGRYLEPERVYDLCDVYGLKHVPVLWYCTLEEALVANNEFDSKVLKVENNVCEGIVIKPTEVQYTELDRVIFKSKNEKWAEKAKVKKAPKVSMTEGAKARLMLLLQYATENRVRAVASKGVKDSFGKLLGATASDALMDAKLDYPLVDFSDVTKAFNKELSSVVRPVFLELLYS